MTGAVTLRAAQPRDVPAIVALVNGYAAEQVMLPRSAESVELALDDFVVAVDARGTVVGCGALKTYSPSLGEVASLAVAREAHGRGLGRAIVDAVEALARSRGVRELFALTLTPRFFEAAGYAVTDRVRYPEKVRRDCLACARRFGCAEVCVRRVLEAEVLDAAA
ncbi:MAG: GNAT family N-acetyltransferase [Gemmatimonadaceae bacterium]|nr:GNAT family N-acetyltransferase [Gemmatimonadaceae bacterium]